MLISTKVDTAVKKSKNTNLKTYIYYKIYNYNRKDESRIIHLSLYTYVCVCQRFICENNIKIVIANVNTYEYNEET